MTTREKGPTDMNPRTPHTAPQTTTATTSARSRPWQGHSAGVLYGRELAHSEPIGFDPAQWLEGQR